MNIFWVEDFVDIFGGHHKIRLHFWVFLRSRYRMGVIFFWGGVAKILNIVGGS